MDDLNRPRVFMGIHTQVSTSDIWVVRSPPNLGLTSGSSMTLTLRARLDEKEGVMDLILTLDPNRLMEVMDCVAGADDTTRLQETSIRDQLAVFRSELSRKK